MLHGCAIGPGYAIALDGRMLKTPKRQPMVLPTEALALAVAAEWAAQTDKLRSYTMPLVPSKPTKIQNKRCV